VIKVHGAAVRFSLTKETLDLSEVKRLDIGERRSSCEIVRDLAAAISEPSFDLVTKLTHGIVKSQMDERARQ
jgi:hypothetical protein